ncbi:DUF6234 family protein [Streptomyces sp. NPDC052052]|uniref:DUF6234 family protein n=1 Tax=Streptomyces sp. NPDC052052 TaxID=3154756 RepID=UPI003417610C
MLEPRHQPSNPLPDPPSSAPRSARPVNGCLDVLLGLLLLVVEGLICALAAFSLAFSRWGPSGQELTGPPPMDWTPVLVFGGFTAVACLFAMVLIRSRWPWAGALQILAALVLCGATVQIGLEDYRRSHPRPAPVPTVEPFQSGHPCRSGGDDRECRDSGS